MIAAGTRLGAYEIVTRIGAGGMGEVYRARDVRLQRDVAVKVLSPEVGGDPVRLARFEREARAASALNHPNIVTIHDIGEADLAGTTIRFMAMELVRGATLRERLAASASEALEWLTQIAAALAKAHAAGIVHRDLKPENVIISDDGFAKIVDFGLAKLVAQSDPELARDATTQSFGTEAGVVLGTVGYMSPEQVEARSVDHRSDIFSFGCIAYEAICGRKAFEGRSAVDTLHRIIYEPPAPMSGVAPELQRIVTKCLAKKPDDRYQSMQDVATDLRALRSGDAAASVAPRRALALIAAVLAIAIAGGIAVWRGPDRAPPSPPPAAPARMAPKTIVVLPFENLGGSEGEAFAAGMTDEITTRLASLSALAVISRSTARHYRDRRVPLRQIGRELGVEYVLDGTVRWNGGGAAPRVRVSPQLVRAADDVNVWTSRFDAPLEDVFEVQSRIAAEIAGALDVRLLEREKKSLRDIPTSSLAAYELYRDAVTSVHRAGFTPESHRRDIEKLEQAVKLDPSFAAAWAWLSVTKSYAYYVGLDRTPETLAAARKAAEEALRLAPDLSASHFAAGMHYWWDLTDTETAARYLTRAAELAPSDPDIYQALGQIARHKNDHAEAQSQFSRAERLDPLNVNVVGENIHLALMVRQYERAVRYADRLITLTSGSPAAYTEKLNALLMWKGPSAEMRALVRTHLSGPDATSAAARLNAFVVDRRYDEALATLRTMKEQPILYLWARGAPKSLVEADIQRLAGRSAEARRAFEEARRELLERDAKHPGDPRVAALLRITEAGLGRRTPGPTTNLVELIIAGDHDAAITQIEASLAKPSFWSKAFIRADPHFDPLRAHPRFRALVE